jgi:hypothetical protein
MARWRWPLTAALAASAISSVAAVRAEDEIENERPTSIDEIPAPARRAIRSQIGGGTLREVVEGTGPTGERVYEGRINEGTSRLIIWVDAAGNILLVSST